MANITIDRDLTDADHQLIGASVDRLVHRLRAYARLYRIGRLARARARLVRNETSDGRMLADVGIDARKHRRYDWVGAMSRAAGGSL